MHRLVAKRSRALVKRAVIVTQRFQPLAAIVAIEPAPRQQHARRVDAVLDRQAWHNSKVQAKGLRSLAPAFAGSHFFNFKIMRTVVIAVGVWFALQLLNVVRQTFATVLVIIDDMDFAQRIVCTRSRCCHACRYPNAYRP